MPSQSQTSPLFGDPNKLVNAHKQTKDAEPVTTNNDLPGGITNGVAQLVLCQLGKYKEGRNKGEPFFMAAGTVKHPVEQKNSKGELIRVLGKRTQIGPIALCDVKDDQGNIVKPFAEAYATFTNHLKLLCGSKDPVATIEASGTGMSPQQAALKIEQGLVALCAELLRVKPHFQFSTREGTSDEVDKVNGQLFVVRKGKRVGGPFATEQLMKAKFPYAGRDATVFHEWTGHVEWNQEAHGQGTGSGMEEEPQRPSTDAQQHPNGQAPAPGKNRLSQAAATTTVAEEPPFNELGESIPDDSQSNDLDLSAEVAAAEAGDKAVRKQMTDTALALGFDQSEIDNAEDWQALADMIVRASKGSEGDEATKHEKAVTSPIPVKEAEVELTLLDKNGNPKVNPVNKKPLKPVKATVKEVDETKKLATLVGADGKTLHKNVPWAAIGF